MAQPTYETAAGTSAFPYPLGAGHTFTLTTSTGGTDRVLLLAIAGDVYNQACPAVSSVTSPGLTFTRLAGPFTLSNHADELHGSGGNGSIEFWWAPAAAQLTSQVITVTLSAGYTAGFSSISGSYGAALAAYEGCSNISSPWDTTVGLPVTVDGAAPQSDSTVNFADRTGVVFNSGDSAETYLAWYIVGLVGTSGDVLPVALYGSFITGASHANTGAAADWANTPPGGIFGTSSSNGQVVSFASFSYTAAAPPPPPPVPDVPSGLTCGTSTTGSITAQWDAVTDATSYDVQYRQAGDIAWIDAGTTTDTGLQITGLADGTAYQWQVSATGEGGTSDWSDSHTCITLTIARTSQNLVWLEWSDDRGHSWSMPVSITFGATGEYLTSLQWQRLGYARDRLYRITWSTSLQTNLQGVWLDVSPARS